MTVLVEEKTFQESLEDLIDNLQEFDGSKEYILDEPIMKFIKDVYSIKKEVNFGNINHEEAKKRFEKLKSLIKEDDFFTRNWKYHEKLGIFKNIVRFETREFGQFFENNAKREINYNRSENYTAGFPLISIVKDVSPDGHSSYYDYKTDLSTLFVKGNKDLYSVQRRELWLLTNYKFVLLDVTHKREFIEKKNSSILKQTYFAVNAKKNKLIEFDSKGFCKLKPTPLSYNFNYLQLY